MNTINGIPIVWDAEGDNNLFGGLFPQGNNLGSNKTFDEISNERALQTPFGKNSLFYTAKQGTLMRFLSDNSQLEAFKKSVPNIDLEKIQLSGGLKEITPQEEPYFCKTQKLQIVQHNIPDGLENYFKLFIDTGAQQLKSYFDNFTWFLEGNQSNQITFHLFTTENHIKEIVCTMGSDIFDCLKITTRVNATGGFTIADKNGKYQVNPELKDFKNHLLTWFKKTYNDSDTIKPKFYLSDNKIENAIDNEFKAEGNYQRTVDWFFDKVGVTTAFKNLLNDCKDTSKKVKSYRIDENQYLPFLPNFDPIFNDTLLKAFGINPNVKIEDYFADFEREDIKKFQLQEKEVNWVFGFNAAFCGLWNALVDTADGFVEIIPSLYEVFTDRGAFKEFLHFVKEFFEHITELMGKLEEWELKNASYSVYRHEYTECYAIGLLATLFVPMPKTAIGERIGATIANSSTKAFETVSEFTQSLLQFIKNETLALAYKMGLRAEKTASEWQLICNDIVICTGTKEKIAKRIENIVEITAKKPNFVFKLLSKNRLEKLVDYKKGKGLGFFTESERLLIQSKLYNANIAVAEFKVSYKGKTIYKEIKAYSNSTVKELKDWARPANFRSGEKLEDFIEITEKGKTGRFQDTESKIFREFEDIHLKEIMQKLGAKSTDELQISVELQTILDPCSICQGQMDKFQKLYNAEIKIYSSGAKNGEKLIEFYPNFEVKNPKKK